MYKLLAAAALVASIAAAPVALSAEQPAPTEIKTAAAEEKKICRKTEVTGSRLGSKKVCKTKAEWQRVDDAAQEYMRELNRDGLIQPVTQVGG